MLGAYSAWALQTYLWISLLPSLWLIFFIVGGLGWIVKRGVIRYLYHRPLDTILATWGIGVMLQQIVRLVVGGELRYVQMPESLSHSVSIFGADTPAYRIFIFLMAAALFGATDRKSTRLNSSH